MKIWMGPTQRKNVTTRNIKVINKFHNHSESRIEDLNLLLDEENIVSPSGSIEVTVVPTVENRDLASTEVINDADGFAEPESNDMSQQSLEENQRNIKRRNRNLLQSPPWMEDYGVSALCEKEALSGSDAEAWHAAMKDEIRAHLKNNTWELVEKKEEDMEADKFTKELAGPRNDYLIAVLGLRNDE
ncbi:hypothetical protein JTB14_024846 [Gonioctena quinquepunctata]|nr:hypothetical protein JTB14_024846 [Gonioctena quinquepunctata]